MVRPLTKLRSNGKLYTRPPAVETQIDEVLNLDLATLRQRLEITNHRTSGYLRSECLVHLIREAIRTGDSDRSHLVSPVLLLRCQAILKNKIPDSDFFDTESLREEVLGQFSEMLANANSEELDFYECRFNYAFRAFRIDLVNGEVDRLKETTPFPLPSGGELEESDEGDVLARLSDAARVPATQESRIFLLEVWPTLMALPKEELQAVIFCRFMGYKIESEDPNEVTAATRCSCSGRTIRNRLVRAATKLARFKED